MAGPQIRLDHAGIRDILNSPEARRAVHETAQQIRDHLEVPDDTDVAIDDYTTDRAATSITIRDVRAQTWQARDGVFTRAAAAAGFEIQSKP